jgi:hypothetical protein
MTEGTSNKTTSAIAVTRLRGGRRVRFPAGVEIVLFDNGLNASSGTHPAFFHQSTGNFYPGSVKLTIHLHLVPRLRMCGAILQLLHTSS